jgi:hypothetical protein
MIMILIRIALVTAVLCAAGPALADDAAPDTASGRYVFAKRADGFVRLDTRTGEVSLCGQKSVGWACEAAPEDRAVLESEIARLRTENAALKKDLLSRGLPLPAGIMPEPLVQNDESQNGAPGLHLPSDADIDRMVTFMDRVWHRFVAAVERAQKQVLNKS